MTAIIDKLLAAWNSGDVARIGDLYTADGVMHHPLAPAPLSGRAAIVELETPMFAAFSELDWRCVSSVAHGDAVAVEFQVTAHNTAPLQTPKGPVPATNRKIVLRGASMLRLASDGRIAEERRYFDSGSLFVQLGLAG